MLERCLHFNAALGVFIITMPAICWPPGAGGVPGWGGAQEKCICEFRDR